MQDTKIEMKIKEEIKPLEEVCKKMTEEFARSIDNTNLGDIPIAGQIVDMIKDLAEAKEKTVKACYYKYILGQMEKCEEEDREEEKYFLKMLKEERKDELKQMMEEYGEDEGERRFYDNYRYANGQFAPKGRGEYRPRSYYRRSGGRGRRGYEEMPYMHMPEMYDMMNPEYMRDIDRESMNRMYYSGSGSNSGSGGGSGNGGSRGSYGANAGGNSRGYSEGGSSGGMSGGSNGGSARGYEEGYGEGERRGYESGYRDGQRSGRSSQTRDRREGRSGQSRRRYFETKEENKGNSAEEKQKKMKELESYMKDIAEDLSEAIGDASNEERTLIKAKLQTIAAKM